MFGRVEMRADGQGKGVLRYRGLQRQLRRKRQETSEGLAWIMHTVSFKEIKAHELQKALKGPGGEQGLEPTRTLCKLPLRLSTDWNV